MRDTKMYIHWRVNNYMIILHRQRMCCDVISRCSMENTYLYHITNAHKFRQAVNGPVRSGTSIYGGKQKQLNISMIPRTVLVYAIFDFRTYNYL